MGAYSVEKSRFGGCDIIPPVWRVIMNSPHIVLPRGLIIMEAGVAGIVGGM